MKTLLIILLLLAIGAAVVVFLIKKGKIKDDDHDFIPDVVEDKVAEVKGKVQKTTQEVKKRANRVKEELSDIKAAAKNLADQTGDVVEAVKGTSRKGRKPKGPTPKKSVEVVFTEDELLSREEADKKDRL